MPLYEYQCQSCGEVVEILQNFSDPPYRHCPKCGGDMKKLFSAPAIQFKGSGFYKTDYASKSSAPPPSSGDSSGDGASSKAESKNETKSESKGDSKSESKGDAKSETKSETKTESKSEAKSEKKSAD
jgi:putative FmdB family regulatory protein